jgi:hypothetical protein
MKRKEIFRKARYIICKGCNTMQPSTQFYVMMKLGGAYEQLFEKEIKEDNQFATCDDCCSNRFVDRMKKYIDN